jgi:DNA replication protein DnaC
LGLSKAIGRTTARSPGDTGRPGSRSTIVTSQLPLDQWHANIGDSTLADVIMDRLVHNAYKIKLEGDSLRKQQANLTTTNEIE